jgi:hypothetical protein
VALQQMLGLPTPGYAHVPLVLGPDGSGSQRHGPVSSAAARARLTSERLVGRLAALSGIGGGEPVKRSWWPASGWKTSRGSRLGWTRPTDSGDRTTRADHVVLGACTVTLSPTPAPISALPSGEWARPRRDRRRSRS